MLACGDLACALEILEEAGAAWGQNGEIAEHLFVTPRAVAFHLGNVYRKLGISGRGELPAALDSTAD